MEKSGGLPVGRQAAALQNAARKCRPRKAGTALLLDNHLLNNVEDRDPRGRVLGVLVFDGEELIVGKADIAGLVARDASARGVEVDHHAPQLLAMGLLQ